jgi:hypothetical protein
MTFMIPARQVELEAALREPHHRPLRGAAVVCHPHPAWGGTMDNRVVYRAAKAANESELAALRFNFRGVGKSTGSYDEGDGERQDAATAVDWLSQRYAELPLVMIGFSFGSWVGLDVGCRDPRIRALVGLGLPLNHYDFEFLVENTKPALYLVSTNDEFCPRDRGDRLARRLPATSTFRWIEAADHFFGGQIEAMQVQIRQFLLALRLEEGES